LCASVKITTALAQTGVLIFHKPEQTTDQNGVENSRGE